MWSSLSLSARHSLIQYSACTIRAIQKLHVQIEINGIVSWTASVYLRPTLPYSTDPTLACHFGRFCSTFQLCCRFWFARTKHLIQSMSMVRRRQQERRTECENDKLPFIWLWLACVRCANWMRMKFIFFRFSSKCLFFPLFHRHFACVVCWKYHLALTYTLCHCEFDDLTRELSWNESNRIEWQAQNWHRQENEENTCARDGWHAPSQS